jgi:predicted flap endonuclease-1-like 5' DNA nuclease
VPAKAERKLPPRVRGYDPTRTATIIKEGRKYLFSSDDLEHAPSIGPKTAEKFAAVGINTVGDFLEHNPDDMAELLDDSQADAETLADWQDQAQLLIDVPGLRGTHAQLLVGAGYRTAQAVAEADPVELSANVLKFVSTSEGKRVLRAGMPPDIEKIKGWVEVARHAVAA